MVNKGGVLLGIFLTFVIIGLSIVLLFPNLTTTTTTTASPKTIGRYVKISQPTVGCLNAASLEVLSNGVDVARGKTVTMSSAHPDFPGSNLVDGNNATFAHTSCADAGSMTVDLGSNLQIDKIILTNRQECCTGRLIGSKIQVINDASNIVYTSDVLKGTAGQSTYSLQGGGFPVYTLLPPSTTII